MLRTEEKFKLSNFTRKLLEKQFVIIAVLIVGILGLFLAFLKMPPEYYSFVRWMVFIICIYMIHIGAVYKDSSTDDYIPFNKPKYNEYWYKSISIPFVIILILFNPLIEIHFRSKIIWIIIDLCVICLFILTIIRETIIKEDIYYNAKSALTKETNYNLYKGDYSYQSFHFACCMINGKRGLGYKIIKKEDWYYKLICEFYSLSIHSNKTYRNGRGDDIKEDINRRNLARYLRFVWNGFYAKSNYEIFEEDYHFLISSKINLDKIHLLHAIYSMENSSHGGNDIAIKNIREHVKINGESPISNTILGIYYLSVTQPDQVVESNFEKEELFSGYKDFLSGFEYLCELTNEKYDLDKYNLWLFYWHDMFEQIFLALNPLEMITDFDNYYYRQHLGKILAEMKVIKRGRESYQNFNLNN